MAVSLGQTSIVSDPESLVLYLDPSLSNNYVLSEVEVLVVAGGGGGGGWGGGGGGGGVIYNKSYSVTPGSAISVTIGNGGTPGTNAYTSGGDGGNSVFGVLTAIGGGGGGHYSNNNGRAGGSGGGGGGAETVTYGLVSQGGSGTPGQGHNGGRGGGRPTSQYNPGGGGGGAGEPGYNFETFVRLGGKGGDGLPFNISGRFQYYGGGGGGHTDGRDGLNSTSFGGKGGGGRGGNYATPRRGLNGAPNTGGGGGGSYGTSAGYECGTGGSGVVIVRYLGAQKATGGNTITNVDGYTIHTFTSGSSTFTPLSAPANSGTIYGNNDLSSNFHSALAYGSPTYNTANGGNINYNGSNYLEIKHTELLKPSTGKITVIAWFNAAVVGNENVPIIFNKEDEYEVAAGGGWVSMAIRPDWNWRRIAPININQWYCVAVSHDGVNQRGYLNAVNTYTNPVGGEVGASYANDLRIGARNAPNAASSLFTGIIGPIQIYNRALTQSEITQNFNALRGRFGI